jgi:hypothetical protein
MYLARPSTKSFGTARVNRAAVKVTWTQHAIDRQKEWFATHAISATDIESVVAHPEQVIPGDFDVFIAQSRLLGGLLRVAFVDIESHRKIVTLYWTSQVERYWKP